MLARYLSSSREEVMRGTCGYGIANPCDTRSKNISAFRSRFRLVVALRIIPIPRKVAFDTSFARRATSALIVD
jgi:hypothetical protein